MTYQEYDVEVGDCLVLDTTYGTLRIGVREVGEDVDGEPLVEFTVDVDKGWECIVDGKTRNPCGIPRCKGLPRIWFLSGYLLSHKVRREIFYPMFNEFLEDYVFARKQIKRRRDRQMLAIAFTWRTVVMLWQCNAVGRETRCSCEGRGSFSIWQWFKTFFFSGT